MAFKCMNLCTICQTGKDNYELDDKMPFCPYLFCHDGILCGNFKRIDNSKTEMKIDTDTQK